jgi:hypothetical protein
MLVKENITEVELTYGLFHPEYTNKNGYQEKTASYYLGRELGLAGLNIGTFNFACLYMHQPRKYGRTKEEMQKHLECEQSSVANLIKVAKDMKIIFMMGAGLVRTFTGYNSSEVYGLTVKSDLLPGVVIIPAPNSDKIMNQPIGELKLAIKRLSEEIKVYKQYMEHQDG